MRYAPSPTARKSARMGSVIFGASQLCRHQGISSHDGEAADTEREIGEIEHSRALHVAFANLIAPDCIKGRCGSGARDIRNP